MPEQEDRNEEQVSETRDKSVELQLGARHLMLAVTALALFGLVLFLLGRWSERLAAPGADDIAQVAPSSDPSGADPAAPRELTFYETLGKRATPPLQEPPRSRGPHAEPPAELPSATAPAAPAAVRSAPDSAGTQRFRVQVASTRDLASARLLVDRLRSKGYPAGIDTESGTDGQSRYKVRIGNYPDRAPAEKLVQKVKEEEKVDAWIVKVQG